MRDGNFVLVVLVLLLMNVLMHAIKHLREWERGVVVRLGKFHDVRGPGTTFIIPLIERMDRINMRPIALDVPPQDILMQDAGKVRITTGVVIRVISPKDALLNVADFSAATVLKTQTVLRDVLGHYTFDDLQTRRDTANHRVQSILAAEVVQWGLTVDTVEIKHVERVQDA
jgi:regulator of protease activity HflC (stomatin/prohibitin superfamily)